MIRGLLGLIFVTIISAVTSQHGFVFEKRRTHPAFILHDESGTPPRRRPTQGFNPGTIDNIFQIPIAIIQGTSAAAQSWYPDNDDTINKVFDVPVQALQAIGNLVKDRIPQNEQPASRHWIQSQKQKLGAQEHLENRRRIKRQLQTQQDQQPAATGVHLGARTHHSFYDPLAWIDALTDVLVGHGGFFGGNGHHGGHKKKRKKKKRPHGAHQHILGGLFTHNPGHFPGIYGSHGPIGAGGSGVHQILGGDNHIYEVTEIIDELHPQDPFPFLPAFESHDKIENKIAPKYDSLAHLIFPIE